MARYGSLEYYMLKFSEMPNWRTKDVEVSLQLKILLKPFEDGSVLSNDDVANFAKKPDAGVRKIC